MSSTQFDVAGAALGLWERNRLLLASRAQSTNKNKLRPPVVLDEPPFPPENNIIRHHEHSNLHNPLSLALGCHAQAGTRTEAKITLVESDTLYHTLYLEYLAEFSKKCTIVPNANLHFPGHLSASRQPSKFLFTSALLLFPTPTF